MSISFLRVRALQSLSWLALFGSVACSGDEGTPGGNGGSKTNGGRSSGGTSSSNGGTVTSAGGKTAATGGTGSGGASNGGKTNGGTGAGGANTSGGTITSGGAGSGGTNSSGSASSGGQGSGGKTTATGGAGSGGKSAGGKAGVGGSGMGGSAVGGSASGGAAAGGTTAQGGSTGSGGSTSTGCPLTNTLVGWATQGGGVTGGGTAKATTVSSLSALNSAASGSGAAVIEVSGTISGNIDIGSNKTIVGACGGKATLKGHIAISGSKNVILRNLNIVGNNCTDNPSDCSGGADAVTVTTSDHIWFDHLDVSDGSDGNLDISHGCDFITLSWTKFRYSGRRTGDHQFSNLIGHSDSNASEDTGKFNITFDHVWWADNVAQRMPRVRFGKVHVVNSLYTASGNDSGVGVGVDANIRVENNVFVGINSAFYFANANSAAIAESVGNTFSGSSGTTGRGTSFKPPYTIALEPIANVQASVRAGAGPK